MRKPKIKTEVTFKAGFILVIGRKRQTVKGKAVFKFDQDLQEMFEGGPLVVTGQRYQVFIDGKLFSTTWPAPNRRNVVKMVKPKRGPIELHLVKKYTELASTKKN